MEMAADETSIVGRMMRAAKLDASLYEEVEHDPEATNQALIVVVGTALAAGIGAGITIGLAGLIFFLVFSLIGWALYAWITYFIGTRIFAGEDTSATWGELARTLGFASTPRVFLVFSGIPVLGATVSLVVAVWILIATVVALRAALDFGTGRAIATAFVGSIVQGVLLGIPLALAA